MFGILQRHVFAELLKVFLLALTALTALFVMVGLVQEASRQGLNPFQILRLVPLVIPSSLPFSIPTTLLLAVSVVYGRLAADNEITAAKSAGIHVFRLVLPALVLGVSCSLITRLLYEHVIPAMNYRLRTTALSNAGDIVYALLKRDRVFKTASVPYELYVQSVQGKSLRNVWVKRRLAPGEYDLEVSAREANLEFDLANDVINVRLYDAHVLHKGVEIEIKREAVFPVAIPGALKNLEKEMTDMSSRELREHAARLRRTHAERTAAFALGAVRRIAAGQPQEAAWDTLLDLERYQKEMQRELRRMSCEPHLRAAVSFGSLFFVLLGCPVAIFFHRGDYLSAFMVCFVPIIALYYPAVVMGVNLSKEGIVSPWILWSGNALLGILSLVAFRPVIRH